MIEIMYCHETLSKPHWQNDGLFVSVSVTKSQEEFNGLFKSH